MKERPDLDKMIDDIQQIIDSDKNSQVRFLHVGTLMDILFLLKEKKEEIQPPIKQDKPELIYTLNGTLHTDGDFRVAVNEFRDEKFRKYIKYDDDREEWKMSLATTDPYYIRDFLEELIVAYRTSTHYWVIPLLYNMTSDAIDFIFNDEEEYRGEMSGNYEGTELVIRKESV